MNSATVPATESAEHAARVAGLIDTLRARLGPGSVSTERPEREAVGRDLWPRSLLESFSAAAPGPAAVVWPESPAQVAEIVRLCARAPGLSRPRQRPLAPGPISSWHAANGPGQRRCPPAPS